MKYYVFTLYLEKLLKDQNQDPILQILDKIKNQNIGNPTTINYLGKDISLDYVLSIE